MSAHLCANHANGSDAKRCTAPALDGLDYCTSHLNGQETYCPIRYCTRAPLSDQHVLCGGHNPEWEASGLTLLEWAETRHNPLAVALEAAKKRAGVK